MAAFLIGIVSLAAVVIGVLALVASALPSFGGKRNDGAAIVVGLVLFFAGIVGVFYAGSWL